MKKPKKRRILPHDVEELHAWDRFAAAAIAGDYGANAAAKADDMLVERRKRWEGP